METPEKTSLGLDTDVACIVCYLGGPITGGLMLLLEKRDLLVRFHAVQSCLLFGPPFLLLPIYFLLPLPASSTFRFFYYMAGGGLVLATLALFFWIVPAAWRLERKRLPVVGAMADRWVPNDGRAEAYDLIGAEAKAGPGVDLSQITFDAVPPAPGQPDLFVALITSGLADKEALLNRVAVALRFPPSFALTWDALDASLGDLSWIPEKRIAIFHPDLPMARHPADLKTYVSCLEDAVGEWKSKGRTLQVIFPPSLKDPLAAALGSQSHVQPLDQRTKA